MKLQIVPARTGLQWVKSGMRTFMRQPMAMAGLFLMFMGLMSLLAVVPYIGNLVALALLPAATLGLMAATKEATNGRFPTPAIMLSAFRAGRQQLRAMLILGALYALGILLILGISATADGGKFARLYMFGGEITSEGFFDSQFETAVLVALALYMPMSMLFWHAPALVHWHGVPPVKSLFFSLIACLRNFAAFTVYNLTWLVVILTLGTLVAIPASLLDNPENITFLMFPLTLLMAAMYFTSIFFTFQDCFQADEQDIITTPSHLA
jgi:MFS family permease